MVRVYTRIRIRVVKNMDLDFLMFSQLMGDVPPVDPKVKEWLQKHLYQRKESGAYFYRWEVLAQMSLIEFSKLLLDLANRINE